MKKLWAEKTLEKLSKSSPSSLLLTLELLKRNKGKNSLKQCLLQEYSLVKYFLTHVNDFYEGIRFRLIEKNRTGIPNWQYSLPQMLQNDNSSSDIIFNLDNVFNIHNIKLSLDFLSELDGSKQDIYCLPTRTTLIKDLTLLKKSMPISEAKKAILHKYKYKTGLYEIINNLIKEKIYL